MGSSDDPSLLRLAASRHNDGAPSARLLSTVGVWHHWWEASRELSRNPQPHGSLRDGPRVSIGRALCNRAQPVGAEAFRGETPGVLPIPSRSGPCDL